MADHKKQHYVPKLYLRNFAVDGIHLSVYNVSNRTSIANVPYDSQCYKDYYYGKDKVWELYLGTLEAKWGVVLKKVLAKEPLADDDCLLIKQFAVYQLQRTVAVNEYIQKQREAFLCEFGRLLYKRHGLTFNSEAVDLCRVRAKAECSPAETLATAENLVPLIQDLELLVIDYHTKQELISSDVPVVAINPFHKPSVGYYCMGLIILFPVSNNTVAILYDAKMYPINRGKLYIQSTDEEEVTNLNLLQFISADRILFARDKHSFSELPSEAWDLRKRNREQKPMTFLGTDDNRLMYYEPRKVIVDCSFSFGRTNRHFGRIPFLCRESPPRQWDEKWQEKLDTKELILPEIICSSSELSKEYGLTRNEIRRGCQRMASAARMYWAKK